MNKILISSILILAFTACIPDQVKEQMADGMKKAQTMMADQEFKRAIAAVELHKLRYGSYPESLRNLKFLSPFDSAMFNTVSYVKLDSGYELNLVESFKTMASEEDQTQEINLTYPEEFWQGLGCVKSNVK